MVRRRKWKCIIIIILMVILELVTLAWSYEGRLYGSHVNSEYSQMQRGWRFRGRRIRNGNGRGQGGGHRRNRLSWEREETTSSSRLERYRPNKRISPGKVNSEVYFPMQSVEECCPTVTHLVEPLNGKNRTGDYVELYRDSNLVQRFYEISCHPEVVNKPCRFIEGRHSRLSTCSQKYSYSYALVTTPSYVVKEEQQTPNLDYISIRSGCSCEVTTPRRKKRPRMREVF